MLGLLAVACLTVTGIPAAEGPLGLARARLAADDLPGAEQAAREAVALAPTHGPTLMVLGQVQFRREKYQEALALFDRAGAGVPPAAADTLAFNRGAALYALSRFREAEAAFGEAARAPRLAALAEVNAGLAAVGAGDGEAARRHADAAAQAPGAAAVTTELDGLRAQIAALPPPPTGRTLAEAAYARGKALYKARRYDEAAAPLAEAVRLEPGDPDLRFVLALDDYRRDRPEAARTGFDQALTLGLDAEGTREAHAYLDRLAGGLRAQGPGGDVRASVSSGYDSNVAQLGESRTEVIAAEAPVDPAGMFLAADLDANYGLRLSNTFFLQLGYAFDELGYQRDDFDPYSLQVHTLGARAELTPVQGLRLRLDGSGDFEFSGLRDFQAFQRVVTVEPQLAADEGAHLTTTVRARWQDKVPFQADDAYYRGTRLDLRLVQRLKLRPVHVDLSYRHRREDIGTRIEDLGALTRTLKRKGITRTFEGTYVVPYAYNSNEARLSGTIDLPAEVSLSIDGAFERLRYSDDSVWYATGPLGRTRELGRRRRKDDRYTATAMLTWAPLDWFEVAVRYDVVVNHSNIDFAFDEKDFTKQVFGVELAGVL